MLSLIQPDPYVSLDPYVDDDLEHSVDMPSATYAYTTMTPLIIQYDTPVSFDYFWIRAHRSPTAFVKKSTGYR